MAEILGLPTSTPATGEGWPESLWELARAGRLSRYATTAEVSLYTSGAEPAWTTLRTGGIEVFQIDDRWDYRVIADDQRWRTRYTEDRALLEIEVNYALDRKINDLNEQYSRTMELLHPLRAFMVDALSSTTVARLDKYFIDRVIAELEDVRVYRTAIDRLCRHDMPTLQRLVRMTIAEVRRERKQPEA